VETVLRTHLAGNLNKELEGQTVTLTGWVARRRDHGGVIFIDLRDRSGLAQVVFRESAVAEAAHDLRSEFVVQVTGTVEPRPEGSANPNLASGEIEVNVTDLKVLNKAAALPFPIEDASSSESARKLACATATWICAASARRKRCVCARRRTRQRAACWTTTTSPRLKPRR